jgi:CelD/BcsL family acetyltransferase involved in cellulose biosynthesis
LQIEEITTTAQLQALTGEWSELWARCPEATPFQTPEWLLPWWRRLGRGQLSTLALRDGERLVGLAPLFRTGYYGLPLRRVCFLGTGNTDYLGALFEPEAECRASDALWNHLRLCGKSWDLCDFQQLRARPEPSLAGGASRESGWLRSLMAQEECPHLALPPSIEEWRRGLSSKLRSNLRYYGRRLERKGAAIEAVTEASLAESLDALFRLHEARWRKRGLPGVFASHRVRAFHREVSLAFLHRGWLRLYALRLRGEIRAVLYCFAARGRTLYYAGGFDPEVGRLSPGTVLTGHAIAEAIREGCSEFDFLRGNEAYKYAWGAVDRVNTRLVVTRSPTVLRLVRAEQRLERWGKQLIRRLLRV